MERVHVYTDGGKSVAVADKTLYFDFELPKAYPENFFYLIWWPDQNFCAYFTQENGSQQRFDLEPTEENYAVFVKPFVDQWQAKNDEMEAEKAEQSDEIAAAAVREKRDQLIAEIESKLGYPVIVKPANLGSSVGISHADNREELIAKIDVAEKYSTRIVIEDMVEELKEINCSVLGDCDDYRTSVCEEPIKSGDILTYEDKYMGGGKSNKGMQATQKRIPADLTPEETARVQFLAGETFRVLSCHGVARVDFMIDGKSGNIYVNEINTIPGSLSFYLWEASGIPFDQLMDRLVDLALKRKRESAMKTVSYDQNIFNLGKGLKGGKMGAK